MPKTIISAAGGAMPAEGRAARTDPFAKDPIDRGYRILGLSAAITSMTGSDQDPLDVDGLFAVREIAETIHEEAGAVIDDLERADLATRFGPIDPIFAAIEYHKQATALYEWTPEKPARAYAAAGKGLEEADAELVATAPTSLAGIRAALEYAVTFCEGDGIAHPMEFMATLLKSPALPAKNAGEE